MSVSILEPTSGVTESNGLGPLGKPRARGWVHLVATPLVLAAALLAVVLPEGQAGRLGTAVFAMTSVVLFGTSAIYHRGTWSPRHHAVLKRLDHANIFLLIAGTYTPLAVLLLDPATRSLLLTIIWVGALAGVVMRQCWLAAPRWVYVPIYVALGWVAVWYLPNFYAAGGALVVVLIIAGGLSYTFGAVIYALKWPNFFPRSFGFHEIFHVFTVLAWCCHYGAILAAM